MLQRAVDQRPLEVCEGAVEGVERVADEQPEVGRDLVVARARGVQASRRRADQFAEPALDIHMNVLERALERERALGDF